MKKQNNETHNQNENQYLYVTSEMTEISWFLLNSLINSYKIINMISNYKENIKLMGR